ncbi:MAG: hypothetical protein H6R41_1733 [Deltaproteobacteria bacterium]|nr:hypothetical protein [Deltaproteobacteria bacterium]
MKIHFDEKADALYLRLDDAPVIESQEVSAGIVLDFDDRRQVVGIEVLDVRKRFPNADPNMILLDRA